MDRRFDDDEPDERQRDRGVGYSYRTESDRLPADDAPRPAPPASAKCVHCRGQLAGRKTVTYPRSGLRAHVACVAQPSIDATDALLVQLGRVRR